MAITTGDSPLTNPPGWRRLSEAELEALLLTPTSQRYADPEGVPRTYREFLDTRVRYLTGGRVATQRQFSKLLAQVEVPPHLRGRAAQAYRRAAVISRVLSGVFGPYVPGAPSTHAMKPIVADVFKQLPPGDTYPLWRGLYT